MKIVLAALNAKYVHSNLAIYDLQAYANKCWDGLGEKMMQNRPEIAICEYTINHNLDLILQSLYQEKAAVVAFSCYIWNISEILSIAKELKKVSPTTQIWLGGPEVSYDSVNRLQKHPYIDGIMQGEGEATFFELTKIWCELILESKNRVNGSITKPEKGCEMGNDLIVKRDGEETYDTLYRNVLGITYREERGDILENPRRPLIPLDEVPFIYADLSKFQNKILYYETSRGCPFSCSYCLSSIDKQVRFRSLSFVKKELKFFLDHEVSQVKFIDRTFNCKKEHSRAIWKYILEHDNGVTNFHFEVAADLLDEEDFKIFKKMRPGLIQLEIGLQSTHLETIQEIRRVMDLGKLKNTLHTVRNFQNIHQHLDLIAGLPYEDFETFKHSFNEAYEMRPNQLQLGFLKVLKGSYIGEKIADYEIQYQDQQPYEVLSTKWISYDEILALKQVEEMVEVYYNSDQFEQVLKYLIPLFETPYAFFEAIGQYYAEHELFGIGFKREMRYEVLRQFCIKWFGKSDIVSVMEDLLTYDFYLRENAKSRPGWRKQEPIEKQKYQEFFKKGGTEEGNLQREGYDSKVAARVMHIEPIKRKAVEIIFEQPCDKEQCYCLFDYEARNPLSKDAKVTLLSHL